MNTFLGSLCKMVPQHNVIHLIKTVTEHSSHISFSIKLLCQCNQEVIKLLRIIEI